MDYIEGDFMRKVAFVFNLERINYSWVNNETISG